MQSSFRNAVKLHLKAASHSARFSFSGELGTRPAVASRSVAVDNAEAAELRLRLTLPPAAEDQPCGRAYASRYEEADAERADRHRREVGAKLGADVGRFTDLLAQRVRRSGELLALGFDVTANFVERAAVATGHRASAPLS